MPEAKLCRFCNRSTLYSLVLTGSLDEKQSHQFLKIWQSLDKKNLRHLPLQNYSLARAELAKIPKTLAWDLSLLESDFLSKTLAEFSVDSKLQGGLPTTAAPEPMTSHPRHSLGGFLYGVLFILVILAGSTFWILTGKKESHEAPPVSVEILPDEAVNSSTQKRESIQNPHPSSEPSKGFGRDDMDHLLNASVFIRDNSSLGSGFFITSDGYILSNAHVTAPMTEPIIVLRDGRKFTATKIKEDSRLDAALLKIPVTGVDFLKIGNANELYAGQPVITIGNPGGLSFTVTRGIVSYLGRIISGVPFIQTDAAINRGNSGGPMINENLEVVGINSMTSIGEQGISFALPINLVCADAGIAAGIRTQPANCESLKIRTDQITPTSLERQKPEAKRNGSDSSLLYQAEVDSLKAQLAKEEQGLADDSSRLNAKATALQAEANADLSNYSKQQNITQQINDIKRELSEIPKKQAEAQIRYLRQVINVLERQRGDPDFQHLSNQIAQQIDQLTSQIRSIENTPR